MNEKEKLIELKPCPFCGGEARVYHKMDIGMPSGDNGHKVLVICEKTHQCGARIEKWAAKRSWARNSAVEAWNRRADDERREAD